MHVLDLVAKIRRTKENLESEGKISDEVAISEETGLSVKRIRKLNTAVKKTVHLDSPLYGEASGCLTHEIVEVGRLQCNSCNGHKNDSIRGKHPLSILFCS